MFLKFFPKEVDLADKFVSNWPEDTLSMAQLQGLFMASDYCSRIDISGSQRQTFGGTTRIGRLVGGNIETSNVSQTVTDDAKKQKEKEREEEEKREEDKEKKREED